MGAAGSQQNDGGDNKHLHGAFLLEAGLRRN
jgi:hypothetical protein